MNNQLIEFISIDDQLKPYIKKVETRESIDMRLGNDCMEAVIVFKHPSDDEEKRFFGQDNFLHHQGKINSKIRAIKHAKDLLIEYALSKGYISEPVKVFNFATALVLLQGGAKITRTGWNGKGMWLSISCPESKEVNAENFWSPHNAEFARNHGGTAKVAPCITFKNAQDEIVMGWIPSSGDLFANDWMVAE